MRFVLASASPRRKEFILEIIKEDKLLISISDVEEVYESSTPEEIAVEIALLKGEKVSSCFPNDLVVSSDTIVVCGNEILGKPVDREDAIRVLQMLSGKTHCVYSAVAIYFNGLIETLVDKTEVEFYHLDTEMIKYYVDTKDPYDKAGSYGIQGFAKLFVKRINGDYSNIVGFPISKFYHKYKTLIDEINNE